MKNPGVTINQIKSKMRNCPDCQHQGIEQEWLTRPKGYDPRLSKFKCLSITCNLVWYQIIK